MTRIVKAEIKMISRSTVVLATSYGHPPQQKEHVLLILEDENGQRGWGESTPLPEFSGETSAVVKTVLEQELLPSIIGIDSFNIIEAHTRMNRAIYGNNAAKMAVDTALFDLNAKSLGIPLYDLLGGKVRSGSRINRHIGIVPDIEAESLAREYAKNGFDSIKVKVGVDVENDIRRLRRIRSAAPDCAIRVDANGGYTFHDALDFINGVQALKIELFEQLLPKEFIRETAEIRRLTGVRICIDEGICSPHDALVHAEAGAADFFTLKLVKIGGLYRAMQIASIAESAHIGTIVANTFDTQVNCSACLHLACALPGATLPNDLTCFATQPTLATTCHTLERNFLSVGNGKGIGVQSLAEFPVDDTLQQP